MSQVCLSVDSSACVCVTYLSQIPCILGRLVVRVTPVCVCVRVRYSRSHVRARGGGHTCTREGNMYGTLRVDVCARATRVKGPLTRHSSRKFLIKNWRRDISTIFISENETKVERIARIVPSLSSPLVMLIYETEFHSDGRKRK